jgi:8-oxo-dGTP pyrophosphatase MutT (NUDIX family)
VDHPGADIARVAGILLVDRAGRLLLQLRDRDAPTNPGKWSIVGGHIEPGEIPIEAARREMAEETGLQVTSPLTLFLHERVPRDPPLAGMIERFIYCAATAATQAEVICGEGEAITFIQPQQLVALDMVESGRRIVEAFLVSEQYAAYVAAASDCNDPEHMARALHRHIIGFLFTRDAS